MVAHLPGHTPLVAGADIAALGQLTQLRTLYLEATNFSASGDGEHGADDVADDADDGDDEPQSAPLPPTDTHMLALVDSLVQLESLHVELTECAYSAHVHADIGRRYQQLVRLRIPAPLDFDMLPQTGPPLFPALEELFARNVRGDHSFEAR